MEIETASQVGASVLRARGRLDSGTSDAFEAALTPLLRGGAPTVVLNLEEVAHVSSAGLRIFLLAAKEAKATGRRVVVCGLSPGVRHIFRLAGFLALIAEVGTEQEALQGSA